MFSKSRVPQARASNLFSSPWPYIALSALYFFFTFFFSCRSCPRLQRKGWDQLVESIFPSLMINLTPSPTRFSEWARRLSHVALFFTQFPPPSNPAAVSQKRAFQLLPSLSPLIFLPLFTRRVFLTPPTLRSTPPSPFSPFVKDWHVAAVAAS